MRMSFDPRPKILFLATGTKTGGGTTVANVLGHCHPTSRSVVLDATVVGIVSNIKGGGVHNIADSHEIPFFYNAGETGADYQEIYALCKECGASTIGLLGWNRIVTVFDPKIYMWNVHPGPPQTAGLYKRKVYERTLELFRKGEIRESRVIVHEVIKEVDKGKVIFSHPVAIKDTDGIEELQARTKKVEDFFVPVMADRIAHGLCTPVLYVW
ncbi:MAG: formyltransferase family protein [bacterium]|nr:formyltransferase family protein [bacterium]